MPHYRVAPKLFEPARRCLAESATLALARSLATARTMMSAALAGLLLASCASPGFREPVLPYQPPSSGATAKLVSRGLVPPGDGYLVSVLLDDERCDRPGMIGSGNALQHPPSTTLAAGRPATIEFHVIRSTEQTCLVRWTFTPAADKVYLIVGVSNAVGCEAVLSDMSDALKIRPEPGALRRDPPGGSRCVPIAQAKPVPVAAAAKAASAVDAVLSEGASMAGLEGLIAP
jgi:hypothetical protein